MSQITQQGVVITPSSADWACSFQSSHGETAHSIMNFYIWVFGHDDSEMICPQNAKDGVVWGSSMSVMINTCLHI